MKPRPLYGFFKRGSSWVFSLVRKDSVGAAIPLDQVNAYSAIFRSDSIDGNILITMNGTNGLSIPTPANGTIVVNLSPTQTVLFKAGTKVYFDVKLTYVDTSVWQSPTYYIVADKEV